MGYNESLRANSNYPPMSQSEWDNAPWNEPTIPEKEFEIQVSQTLVKTCDVITDKYIPGPSWVEWESDEEGGHAIGCHDPDDTSDTDWEQEYKDQHYTILELLAELEEMARKELENTAPNSLRGKELKNIIDECQGWELDDSEYEEA